VLGFWLVNLAVFLHVVAFDLPLWVMYAYSGLLYCLGALLSYYSRTVQRVFVVTAEGVMFGLRFEVVRRFRPVAAGVAFGLVVTASYVASYVAFAAAGS
jgi:hypothetical protein